MKNQLYPAAVCNNKKDIPNPGYANLRIILQNHVILPLLLKRKTIKALVTNTKLCFPPNSRLNL
ncbi:hypothetical protein E4G67_00785 [Candidatus Bathyarchaeota archaeon]|nr:MAG: hypothetical protein E4G67_00785 [Candidatus Bathyarchaeota archaeon]